MRVRGDCVEEGFRVCDVGEVGGGCEEGWPGGREDQRGFGGRGRLEDEADPAAGADGDDGADDVGGEVAVYDCVFWI